MKSRDSFSCEKAAKNSGSRQFETMKCANKWDHLHMY